MKNILTILLVAILSLSITGCSDWLTLRPESDIVLDDFWNNESEVSQVLASCYRSLTEKGAVERYLVWGESRSDNIVMGGTSVPYNTYRMIQGDITLNNDFLRWGDFYNTINLCNTFLKYAPGVVDKDEHFTEMILNSYKAEVLGIRALAYFYLVRTFRDVPWVEEASIDDNQDYRPFQTPENVLLGYLIEDLKFAEKYSRDKFESKLLTKARLTKSGIRALMADIYMWMEDYENAVKYCDLVISNPDLELVSSKNMISSIFYAGNSTESIFELQFDKDNMPNDAVNEYLGNYSMVQGFFGFPLILVSGDSRIRVFNIPVGMGIESKDDIRRKIYMRNYSIDVMSSFKYSGAVATITNDGTTTYTYASRTPNWIVYRLSDIVLLKAEALTQLNRLEEAIDLVNLTYIRANSLDGKESDPLSIENYSSQNDIAVLVLRERQRELVFEGKRWFDLMRIARREGSTTTLSGYVYNKFSGSSSGGQSVKLSSMDALYLPIHENELKNNKNLVQNPFYEIENDMSNKNKK